MVKSSTEIANYSNSKIAQAEALQPEKYAPVVTTATNFTIAEASDGFKLWIPISQVGTTIAVTTRGGSSYSTTLTDADCDCFFRNARFTTVTKIGTTATGIEAWY